MSFPAAFAQETRRLARAPFDLVLLILAPAILLGLMAAMISPGSLNGLSVIVVDRDGGPLAHDIIRNVLASPKLRLAGTTPDIGEALSAIRRERAVAVLVVPRGAADARAGRKPIEILYEAQFLAPGSLASSALETAAEAALARSAPPQFDPLPPGASRRAPPGLNVALLGNPKASLEWYLGLLLGPGVLHLSIAITAIGSLGLLVEDGSFAGFARNTPRLAATLAGRLAPHVLIGAGWGIAWFIWLTLGGGYRIEGSMAGLAGALLLMAAATAALALMLLALTRSVATALSTAVIVTGSALAYSGASLPINGAAWPVRVWNTLLPLTHYLRLQMDEVIGATAAPMLREAALLLLCLLVAGGAGIVLIARAGARPA